MPERPTREVTHPTPNAIRDGALRVAATALRSETADRPSLLEELSRRITWPTAWVEKGEHYATAAPLIKHLANHMVAGHGWDAQFKRAGELLPKSDMARALSTAQGLVMQDMRKLFVFAAKDFEGAHANHGLLVKTYSAQGVNFTRRKPGISTGEGLVAGGGDFPGAIADYVVVLNDLIGEDPMLRDFAPEARRDLAHQLLPQALGRDAKQHNEDFLAAPSVTERHAKGLVSLKVSGDDADVELRGAHTSAREIHQPGFQGYETPSLVCPAHWQFEGEPETALETFIHAGINHAYTLGSFGMPEIE